MSRNRQSIGNTAVVGFLQKEMLQPLHHSHRVNRNRLDQLLFYLRHALSFNKCRGLTEINVRDPECCDTDANPKRRCRLVAPKRTDLAKHVPPTTDRATSFSDTPVVRRRSRRRSPAFATPCEGHEFLTITFFRRGVSGCTTL